MGLPDDGDVTTREVNEWVQAQALYLAPTRLLLLWYLSANAFLSEDNPEGRHPGEVLSGRTAIAKICLRTGMGERTVRDGLRDLQAEGYIVASHKPGNGRSEIAVFWGETYDDLRDQFRAGIKPLPKGFQRPVKEVKSGLQVVQSEGVVLPFRTGK